ncbi:hypothetical protein [Streptomyces sp. Tue6028]|uniref:hypothetical protein n=1 Tax=Streptomyces sp. Tue6028 TaxID=2036037 RepID=UPI003D712B08
MADSSFSLHNEVKPADVGLREGINMPRRQFVRCCSRSWWSTSWTTSRTPASNGPAGVPPTPVTSDNGTP